MTRTSVCGKLIGVTLVIALWIGSYSRPEFAALSLYSHIISANEWYSCSWLKGRSCTCEEKMLLARGIFKSMQDSTQSDYDGMGVLKEIAQFQTRDGILRDMEVFSPRKKESTLLPVIVYIHGGGWVMGGPSPIPFLDVVKDNAIVFSPDYRLAPEHKFPVAVNDCEDAVNWIVQNAKKFGGDSSHITLSGTSAGGNLAAALSIVFRDQGKIDALTPKISNLILDIPLVSFLLDDQSSVDHIDSYIWNSALTLCARYLYFSSWRDYEDPRASPLLAESHAELPRTLIIACELDPFVDGAMHYHKRLLESKVESKIVVLKNSPHGAAMTPSGPLFAKERETFLQEIAAFLNQ